MRGFCLLLAVFAMLYQLASAQSSPTQGQLREEQDDIVCTLKANNSLSMQFESSVRESHGVQRDFGESMIIDNILYRSLFQFNSTITVEWYIFFYSPSWFYLRRARSCGFGYES